MIQNCQCFFTGNALSVIGNVSGKVNVLKSRKVGYQIEILINHGNTVTAVEIQTFLADFFFVEKNLSAVIWIKTSDTVQ